MKFSKDNIEIILKDPKKSVIKLSLPLIVGGLAQTLYVIVDGIWVAGLGEKALAAVGLFSPLMMIMVSIAMGIGVGCSSAISRALGAKGKKYAESVAKSTIILSTIIGTIIGIIFYISIDIIFLFMRVSKETLQLSTVYGRTVILASPFMFFSNAGNSILKGEGDTRKATYTSLAGSISNIILDPIFIYTLNLGTFGAAVATFISILITFSLVFYIIFIQKSISIKIDFKDLRLNRKAVKDVFSVGIPTIFAQLTMSVTTLILSVFVISVEKDYGLAIFSGGWKIVSFLTTPLLSMASAITVITGVAYGAKNFDALKLSYTYSIKLGMMIGLAFSAIIWCFAPQIAYLFSYSEDSRHLLDGIVEFLRLVTLYFPGIAGNMFTAAMFRGIGKGTYSLVQTVIRTIIMQVVFSYVFTIVLKLGLRGIWISIVIANWSASLISLTWGKSVLNKISNTN